MKTQSFGVSDQFHGPVRCRRFWWSREDWSPSAKIAQNQALQRYRADRENGTGIDSPDRPFPDPMIERDYVPTHHGNHYHSFRYIEAGEIKAWMEEKDRNYSIRLNHERKAADMSKQNKILGLGVAFFIVGLIAYREASDENHALQILNTLLLALGLYLIVKRAGDGISYFSKESAKFFRATGNFLNAVSDNLRNNELTIGVELEPIEHRCQIL